MKKSKINAKEFGKDIDKATNLLKKIEEAEDIFKLDLNSIKKEIDKVKKEFEEKYKDFLPEEDLDSKK
tara:strand:- start:163 stop:366 length:204 start_codon:yes stop_codon:yes gene_type:complete